MEYLPIAAILLGGLSAAALLSAIDDDDDDNDIIDEPEQTLDDDITGTSGDDVIDAQGDAVRDWSFAMVNSETLFGVQNTNTGDEYALGPDHTFESLDGTSADTLPGLTEVSAGDGNDTITLTGEDLLVYESEGADSIDATAMGSGVIEAGEGDIVLGSDVAGAEIKVFGEDYTFEGGSADEYAFAEGYGSLSGGGGSDTLVAEDIASLSGGDGDDYLRGNYDKAVDRPQGSDFFADHTNDGPNVLDGGAGNDRIDFDTEDKVTGGDGADSLTGYLEVSPDEAASISDFDPAEDNLTIWVEKGASDVTLGVENGNTLIVQDGKVLATIQGQSSLTLGYQVMQSNGDFAVVDANGDVIDRADVDVVVGDYPTVVT